MAEGTASRVQVYAREGAGGAISLEKRVEASWNAACPGQEILHGVQYLGVVTKWELGGFFFGDTAGDIR